MTGADPTQVSERAMSRGAGQVGSLGSGNLFLEVQVVDEIYDDATAVVFGLRECQVCVMIHCGSRGLGHQICSDHVRAMLSAMTRYRIEVPDRQLACAPVESPEGRGYLGAMAAAANFGRANRQVLADATRSAFVEAVGRGELRGRRFSLGSTRRTLWEGIAHDATAGRRPSPTGIGRGGDARHPPARVGRPG